MTFQIPAELALWEKLVIPILVALFSWFLKDFFLGITNARDQTTREEWQFRLKEIWSPLYFWSGVLCFDGGPKSFERYGAKELSEVLAKAAYLLPKDHYNNFVRLLQQVTEQKTQVLSFEEFAKTRRYIYGQIEVLNHVLYRQYEWMDPATQTDVLASLRQLLSQNARMSSSLSHCEIEYPALGSFWSRRSHWLFNPFASPRISRAFLKAASKASHCPGRILPQIILMCISVTSPYGALRTASRNAPV